MNTSTAKKLSWIAGASLLALSGSTWPYFATSVGACNSATCQVIGSIGGSRSAQAVFEVVGSDLLVTVINTSWYDAVKPSDLLTGLVFNVNYADGTKVSLSPQSALMEESRGSVVNMQTRAVGSADSNSPGQWQYTQQNMGFQHGLGGEYGITTAGDDPDTGIDGSDAVTQNAVQYKLAMFGIDGKALDLSASGALSAAFQYGTSFGGGPPIAPEFAAASSFAAVAGTAPTPGTAALLTLGIALLVSVRRVRPQ